jgi:hypothetical protein
MFISDPTWPSSLTLDLQRSNWPEWSRRLELLANRQGLFPWLNGTLACPDPAVVSPKICWVWWTNDSSLRSFILQHVSSFDYNIADKLPTSSLAYAALRKRHEQLGTHAQAHLMKQIMDTQFMPGTPLMDTAAKINNLHESFVKMGTPDFDKMHCAWLVNAASQHFRSLQSTLQALTRDPSCTPQTILARLQDEDDLHRRRTAHSHQDDTQAIALLARPDNPFRNVICLNCKRPGHTNDFCVRVGGRMAGRTIDEARAAQARFLARRNTRTSTTNNSAHIATTVSTNTTLTTTTSTGGTAATPNNVVINGVTYAFVPVQTTATSTEPTQQTAQSLSPITDLASLPQTPLTIDSGESWEALFAFADDDELHTTSYAFATDSNAAIAPPDATPFILDTGATCHISPVRSDFRILYQIPPRAIKGLGDSCVFANEMGTVDIPLTSGQKLTLSNVLYVPNSRVRLLSVLTLNRHDSVSTHFDANSCWITDVSGSIIATGKLLKSCNLYVLSTAITNTCISSPFLPSHEQVYVSRSIPNIETWHRRLGHCNIQTVLDMA